MASSTQPLDLIVLVADSNTENAVKGLLSRPEALGIRALSLDIVPHPERDPGCWLRAPELLRSFRVRYRYALVLLDRHGSGQEKKTRLEMEKDLGERLASDWGDRAAAVVLDPELEVWLWSDSPHVEAVLGWKDRNPSLRSWLAEKGFMVEGTIKPSQPKEAVEKALRAVRKPRSSALYRELAGRVSFERCTDPAFARFKEVLRGWFGRENTAPYKP